MADEFEPLLVNDAGQKIIQALMHLQFTAHGGIEITRSPDGSKVNIGFRRKIGRGSSSNQARKFAQIAASPVLISGENARWLYTGYELDRPTATGRGQLKAGGIVYSLYNSVEDFNPTTGIGTMGSGHAISSTEFSNGIKLLPVRGLPVLEILTRLDCNNVPENFFTFPNTKNECPS